jgi:hypothetical protein
MPECSKCLRHVGILTDVIIERDANGHIPVDEQKITKVCVNCATKCDTSKFHCNRGNVRPNLHDIPNTLSRVVDDFYYYKHHAMIDISNLNSVVENNSLKNESQLKAITNKTDIIQYNLHSLKQMLLTDIENIRKELVLIINNENNQQTQQIQQTQQVEKYNKIMLLIKELTDNIFLEKEEHNDDINALRKDMIKQFNDITNELSDVHEKNMKKIITKLHSEKEKRKNDISVLREELLKQQQDYELKIESLIKELMVQKQQKLYKPEEELDEEQKTMYYDVLFDKETNRKLNFLKKADILNITNFQNIITTLIDDKYKDVTKQLLLQKIVTLKDAREVLIQGYLDEQADMLTIEIKKLESMIY